MAVVTQTDRPKFVRNRYVIKVFGGLSVLSLCFFEFSVGVGVFVIGPSQIFFLLNFTDRGSPPEMRVWSILLIKSGKNWCIHL